MAFPKSPLQNNYSNNRINMRMRRMNVMHRTRKNIKQERQE